MHADLFAELNDAQQLPAGASFLPGFALPFVGELAHALEQITLQAPFRKMITPGGHQMSVAMTNCGDFGWISSWNGYEYLGQDPVTGHPWPPMPDVFMALALDAAAKAGYPFFAPDACLINRYEPGSRLSLHQDKNEHDFSQPIVSVSLGLPATFEFGGKKRRDPVRLIFVQHGDVLVWGGPSRMFYHGVRTLRAGVHPDLGAQRINLTFRRSH